MNSVDSRIYRISLLLRVESMRVTDGSSAANLIHAADALLAIADEVKRMAEALDGLVGDAMRQTREIMDVPTAMARILAEHAAKRNAP